TELFAVHLHGHMHENGAYGVSIPGLRPRYLIQGCSLFGLETLGDDKPARQHGYAAGRIDLGAQPVLRLWPRLASKTYGCPWQMIPDKRFGRLLDDEGTDPPPITPLRRPPSLPPPPPPGVGAMMIGRSRQPPGNAYDPNWYVPREKEEQRARSNLENDG